MGYYEVNVVAQRWIQGAFLVNSTYKYYTDTLQKEDIDIVWQFIRNNRLMAAKQKISFCSCTYFVKGKPVRGQWDNKKLQAKTLFKKYCRKFEPKLKLMEMAFTTPRDRVISVSITHRKQEY